jgi:hypothetical protein
MSIGEAMHIECHQRRLVDATSDEVHDFVDSRPRSVTAWLNRENGSRPPVVAMGPLPGPVIAGPPEPLLSEREQDRTGLRVIDLG